MENVEITRVLAEVADLLEIQGANPFRVRAYRNAVRTIEGLGSSLADMVARDEDLTRLPTIGKDISGYIRELVDTGELTLLRELEKEVPESLAELLRLDGVGPKRAERLWRELGIESLDDLEQGLDDGRVRDLAGFGEKTVARLRRSIAALRKRGGRVPLAEADQLVGPLVAHLEEAPGVERVVGAGSWRRRKETVGDLDVLAVADDPGPVMKHFTRYPGAERVESAGDTRGTLVLRTGLHVDLRVVPPESYGSALHYLTGSRAHNVAMRRRGVERGLKINEYGVFETPGRGRAKSGRGEGKSGRGRAKAGVGAPRTAGAGRRVGGREEEDLYRAVGLVWTPPELREDRGEIEAAAKDALPALIESGDIRGDLQMHTTWSDGTASIRKMAEAAREMGYAYLAVTDHSARVAVTRGMDAERVERQAREIERVRGEVEGIHLFHGIEVDILEDGSLDMDDEHLEALDFVVASVHTSMNLSRKAQTARVVEAISHPAVHVLGHPTGRLIGSREPMDLDLDEILRAAGEHGVAVELNAHPQRLDLSDLQVRRARELGVPVVIDTDAHAPEHLRFMGYGVDQARRGWLEKKDVLNTKSLRDLRAWLKKKR